MGETVSYVRSVKKGAQYSISVNLACIVFAVFWTREGAGSSSFDDKRMDGKRYWMRKAISTGS